MFKIHRNLRLTSAIAGIGLTIGGCQGTPEPSPCAKLIPPTAAFTIQEEIVVASMQLTGKFEVDTVGASNTVPIIFTALDSVNATYEWVIGADPRVYRSRTVRIFFENSVGPVTVRLKVNTTTATGCTAFDGKEVIGQKTLVVLPPKEAPIFGDYEGYSLSAPSRKFTIQIRNNSLLNLPEGCTYNLRDELKIGSTALFAYSGTFDPAYGAGSLEGKAVLDRNDRRAIVFEYTYSDPKKAVPGTRLRDKFIGHRK